MQDGVDEKERVFCMVAFSKSQRRICLSRDEVTTTRFNESVHMSTMALLCPPSIMGQFGS